MCEPVSVMYVLLINFTIYSFPLKHGNINQTQFKSRDIQQLLFCKTLFKHTGAL